MRCTNWTMAAALVAAAPAIAVAQPARSVATTQGATQGAIEAAMADSAAGWNAGDLDRFMAVYAADATYVTRDGLKRGKAEIAARYRPSFTAGGNSRGRLAFEPLALRTLSPVHAILTARWRLIPASGAAQTEIQSGLTTLVFERRREGWKIIADHSS